MIFCGGRKCRKSLCPCQERTIIRMRKCLDNGLFCYILDFFRQQGCTPLLTANSPMQEAHRPLLISRNIVPSRFGMGLWLLRSYWIWVITRCADTGRVPPADGVIVRAAAVPSGFRTRCYGCSVVRGALMRRNLHSSTLHRQDPEGQQTLVGNSYSRNGAPDPCSRILPDGDVCMNYHQIMDHSPYHRNDYSCSIEFLLIF